MHRVGCAEARHRIPPSRESAARHERRHARPRRNVGLTDLLPALSIRYAAPALPVAPPTPQLLAPVARADTLAPVEPAVPVDAVAGYHFTVVPHTHWDREWYLPFEVFRLRLVRTVEDICDV